MTESTQSVAPTADAPAPTFADFGLHPLLLQSIAETGYTIPTPIQAQAIPVVVEGRDVMGAAQTGTGKTAAFTLPILHRLMPLANASASPARHPVRALILTPTRELADQVYESVKRYSKQTPLRSAVVFGGVDIGPQKEALRRGCEVLVATPGRLLDHVEQKNVNLSQVGILVLDEADRMLDMGFSDAIDEVIRFAPASRQTLLFSATWPEAIAAISGRVQNNPQTIEIDAVDALPAIEQQFFETSQHGKITLLQKLLSQHQPASCVVFCNTKKDCQAVCDSLNAAGQSALSLHGDLEQRDRDQTLVRFANGSSRVLVATDVAARGLDIKSLELVVNYELAWDPEVHVHRIGRTARAGESGLAISLCAPEEAQRANILAEMLQMKLNWMNGPTNSTVVPLQAEMATLCIDGGKKAKMRAGDVLGALTGDIGLDGADIGKIAVHPAHVYVAVRQGVAHKAFKQLQNGKIKGKACRVRLLK